MTGPRLEVLPPLSPAVYLRRPVRPLPYPLDEPGCRLYAQGRQALYHGVRAAGLGPGDEILVPAYHHGSEVEALRRAGLLCRFYEATDSLEPDEAELAGLLTRATRALHLIHHLGFPQDAPRWRRWCDDHGLLLVEDAAQAWLADVGGAPVGSFGDVAIFCLYKAVGVPDGAAGVQAQPPPPPARPPQRGLRGLVWRHAAWLRGRGVLAGGEEREAVAPAVGVDEEFGLGDPERPPSVPTSLLLRRAVDHGTAARRREHYAFLLQALADRVPPPFDVLPAGASPFAFPIRSADKPGELRRLSAHGIAALDLWSFGHPALPADRFPAATRRRRELVALPVHQELRPEDLRRLVGAAAHPEP